MTTDSSKHTQFLTAALRYAELGYRVCPCVPGTKAPLTHHGFNDATTDVGIIEAWWRRWPTANIGISTDGLMLVDADGMDNAWLQDDQEKLFSLSAAPHSDSPSGGVHRLFRQPAGRAWRCTAKKLAPKVDTRGYGGMFLAEPSVFKGKQYRWRPTLELEDRPDQLPEPPAWLIAELDALDQARDLAVIGDANPVPDGQRNSTLTSLAGSMRRVGMSQVELLAALEQVNADRCQPPLSAREVARIAQSVARYAPDEVATALAENHYDQMYKKKSETIFTPAHQLCLDYPNMRPPVIHGLLREGEIMNVIAAPKAGKSWLVMQLALAVAAGDTWLNYKTDESCTLLIDNELHSETLANRIPRVAKSLGLPEHAWKDRFFVRCLRGEIKDLYQMEAFFQQLPVGHFRLIILDAFYRFIPKGTDENDNGAVANLYNLLDRHALRLGCAFVLIHHTSKGLQSGRGITDVGAGAGSQSRATDAHFIMREHEEPNCLSIDAVARSWPPPSSFVIRRDFPTWKIDSTLDPADLKKPERRTRKKEPQPDPTLIPEKRNWTAMDVAVELVGETHKTREEIYELAEMHDLSERRVATLLRRAEQKGLIHRWRQDWTKAPKFSTLRPEGSGSDESSAGEKSHQAAEG